jgi:tyrosyl-tRNA synthetase
VGRFLGLFTFLPMDEVRRLGALEGAELREAKEILADEATRLCHGEEEAQKARAASRALFGGGGDLASVPTAEIPAHRLGAGVEAFVLFCDAGLAKSRGEARRLIEQGGAYVNGEAVTSIDRRIGLEDVKEGVILLRAGKKKYCAVRPG